MYVYIKKVKPLITTLYTKHIKEAEATRSLHAQKKNYYTHLSEVTEKELLHYDTIKKKIEHWQNRVTAQQAEQELYQHSLLQQYQQKRLTQRHAVDLLRIKKELAPAIRTNLRKNLSDHFSESNNGETYISQLMLHLEQR